MVNDWKRGGLRDGTWKLFNLFKFLARARVSFPFSSFRLHAVFTNFESHRVEDHRHRQTPVILLLNRVYRALSLLLLYPWFFRIEIADVDETEKAPYRSNTNTERRVSGIPQDPM